MARPTYVILVLSQTGDKDGISPPFTPPFPPLPLRGQMSWEVEMGRRPENGRGDFPQFIPFSLSMHSKFGLSMFVQVYTVQQ